MAILLIISPIIFMVLDLLMEGDYNQIKELMRDDEL